MALSKAQRMALFNILDIPWIGTINKIIDGEHLVVLQNTVSAGYRQAVQQLNDYISNVIEADTDFETQIKTLLDRWLELGTEAWSLDNGAVGAVQGMTVSPRLERAEIERQIQKWVPFYEAHKRLGTAAAGSASSSVVMLR